MRIKICRKEAKESHYWLRLINTGEDIGLVDERNGLLREAKELTAIFGAIVQKSAGG